VFRLYILRSLFAASIAATLICSAGLARAEHSPVDAGGPAIEIEVVGLRNDTGQVSCSLFNSPDGFPRDGKVVRRVWARIQSRKALCRFDGMPAGRYAAVVYHDENSNGEFDQNALGMPLEGFGFSNNASILFGPPSFKSASFDYSGGDFRQAVKIRYWSL
jgi:uncharacterized protein (DUF2141 family)